MNEEGMQETPNKMIHIGKPIEIDENELKELRERAKNMEYGK